VTPQGRQGRQPRRGGVGDVGGLGFDAIRDVLAIDVDPEPIEFILDDPKIPRRGITLIVGYRGVSKTTLACWLLARVTKNGERASFIGGSGENDIRSFVRPRLEAAGADLSLVGFPNEDDPPLSFPMDYDKLERYIVETKAKMIVLDPLSAFINVGSSSTGVRDALQPLTRLSQKHDVSIVFVHHFRKTTSKTVEEAIGGSGGLQDVARAVYVYGTKPQPTGLDLLFGFGAMFQPTDHEEDVEQKNVRMLANVKLNVEATPPAMLFEFEVVSLDTLPWPVPRVRYLGETEVTGQQLYAGWMQMGSKDEESMSALDEAITFVLSTLMDMPDHKMPTTELFKEGDKVGHAMRTLQRACQKAKVRAVKGKDKDGKTVWFKQLPELPDNLPEEWT
jgi:hypothetical protein